MILTVSLDLKLKNLERSTGSIMPLKKLPKKVRNKMGYMKKGGRAK